MNVFIEFENAWIDRTLQGPSRASRLDEARRRMQAHPTYSVLKHYEALEHAQRSLAIPRSSSGSRKSGAALFSGPPSAPKKSRPV
jgi:hypothetical protein